MRKALFPALLLIAVAACATAPRWTWEHERKSEAETRQGLERCRSRAARELADTYAGMTPLGFEYTDEKNDLVRHCMERKGYFYKKTDEENNDRGDKGVRY